MFKPKLNDLACGYAPISIPLVSTFDPKLFTSGSHELYLVKTNKLLPCTNNLKLPVLDRNPKAFLGTSYPKEMLLMRKKDPSLR
jgi:hypothetical protein